MALLTTLWRALVFIPVCFCLFLLGTAKGILVGPAAFVILVVGHTGVTFGLWPVHVVMTYYTIAKAKKLGPSAKLLSFFCLPVPLVLWPLTVIIGSVLVGLGYGFITPQVATFEAIGAGRENKIYHVFLDGTWSILKGSCTVVRDFTDLSFHSFMDYLKDFREKEPKHGHPYEIKLLEIPGCVLVAVLGVLLDVPVITGVAMVKAPIMLFKGWDRLVKDLWGRQGPFLEAVCVPFAGLAIVLWPLVVAASILASIAAAPFLGLYGAVIVYQERSVRRGLAYIVNVLAQYDEYTNDVLLLSEGSCFPRPKYRDSDETNSAEIGHPKAIAELQHPQQTPPAQGDAGVEVKIEGKAEEEKVKTANEGGSSVPFSTRLSKSTSDGSSFLQSKSLRKTIQEVKVVQVWDNLFLNMDKLGKELVRAGVFKASDLEEWLKASKKDKSKMISVGLPACSTLNSVIYTAKSGVPGILLYDGTEITVYNRPQDRLGDWLYEPLLVLKEQLKVAKLTETEEQYMQKWILTSGDPALMEIWQNGGIEPEDNMRKGELQALCRRLQGMTISYSRLPTFPRRYQKFINSLLLYAQSHSSPSIPPVPKGDEAV
ncbi:unnamed protein product [Calypogeia fissa]